MFLFPASDEEMDKVDAIDRSSVYDITIRMPQWWCDWYYSLPLEQRYKFAKIIEERIFRCQISVKNLFI
jgi:hypothetical protein